MIHIKISRLACIALLPLMMLAGCSKKSSGNGAPVTPPVVPGTDPVGAPAKTWQEHWFDHVQLVSRVFYDSNLVVYYDNEVSRTIVWPNKYLADVWKYTKKTYGTFGVDERLFAVFHVGKYGGGHPSTYLDASHDYHNTIDVGSGASNAWITGTGNDLDLTTHEVAHIVEGASRNVKESPAFDIWGDSKWAEIFNYDVYKGLGREDDATRWFNMMVVNKDNFPRANTFWFRDWFYPVWSQYGKSEVLKKYFVLLSQYFPKNNGSFTRKMNWGEFVHFWSGAAGANLKTQATTAFGWTSDWELQFNKARTDFANIIY